MAIEKYLNPEMLFDPEPSYIGVWFINYDNLLRNAKKDELQNYFENNLYIPLKKCFKNINSFKFSVGLMSYSNSNFIGRKLTLNKADFYLNLIKFFKTDLDRLDKTKEEMNDYLLHLSEYIIKDNEVLNETFSKAFKEKESKYIDIEKNGFSSKYYDYAMKDYERHIPDKSRIPFSTYIRFNSMMATDLKEGLLLLGDFFEKKLDYEELYKCFDPDTFYLLFSTIIYDNLINEEKNNNKLNDSVGFLYSYFDAVKEVAKEDKRYDPSILYIWKDGKKEKFTRWNLQNRFEELVKKYPNSRPIIVPDTGKNIQRYEEYKMLFNKGANWRFLEKGEKIKQNNTKKDSDHLSVPKEKKDIDTLIKETNMRIDILEKSGYMGRPIEGLDTFNGYYAFIYANGRVVLEKFWEDQERMLPAKYEATYVMNINNFIEKSKLTKTQLIEYMKDEKNGDVQRIFHRSVEDWQQRLYKVINGDSIEQEKIISFVKGLGSKKK